MTSYKPEGIPALSCYVFVAGVVEFAQFAKEAFGGVITAETKHEDGTVYYSTLQFDDGWLFAHEAGEESPALPTHLYLYVPDIDATYKNALAAGATSVSKPAEQVYGDRNAAVKDRWGNTWWLAWTAGLLSNEEVAEDQRKARADSDN